MGAKRMVMSAVLETIPVNCLLVGHAQASKADWMAAVTWLWVRLLGEPGKFSYR
jgi:hypothetical protein